MRIDLDAIDRERFSVKPDRVCGMTLYLIKPTQAAMWDWRDDELHMRSLLVRDNGEVVSSGFPKFFNYGERPERDALIDIEHSRIREKHDGTLIIRSVINGQVHFRTRGQHGLGEFEGPVMRLLGRDALDPNRRRASSTLLEYVGPENQIVIRYDEPRLHPLGHVRHDDLHLSPARLVDEHTYYSLPSLLKEQRERRGAEGVVVWTHLGDSWHLTKVKSAEYLKLHSLRSMMTETKVWAVCAAFDVTSVEQAAAAFGSIGLDWEVFTQAHEPVEAYLQRRQQNTADLADLLKRARGGIARALQQAANDIGRGDLFPVAIQQAVGHASRADAALKAAHMGMGQSKALAAIAEIEALSA